MLGFLYIYRVLVELDVCIKCLFVEQTKCYFFKKLLFWLNMMCIKWMFVEKTVSKFFFGRNYSSDWMWCVHKMNVCWENWEQMFCFLRNCGSHWTCSIFFLWSYWGIFSASFDWLWYWKLSVTVTSNTLWCYR
jgi:hypothetical protein